MVPVIGPGAAGGGARLSVMHVEELLPQLFVALTQIFPVVVPKVTEILVVPCPEFIVVPAGTVQVYEVAPGTAEIEYVSVCPGQTASVPEIDPGAAGGAAIVIETQRAVLVPQAFDAVTQILPLVAPAVMVMEVVPCPEVMVVPAGTVQLYDVAPVTAEME